MKKKALAFFGLMVLLVAGSCSGSYDGNNDNSGSNNTGKYSAEFRGEWIRMDTGDSWYINNNSILVNGEASNLNVTMQKTSDNVAVAKQGGTEYTLFAARTANASFNAEVIILDVNEENAGRSSQGTTGQKPPIIVRPVLQPDLERVVVPNTETGKIIVDGIIPGDPLVLIPNDSYWNDIVINLNPGWGTAQEMGTIALTLGDNFKISVRMDDAALDLFELYADDIPRVYVFEIENISSSNSGDSGFEVIWDDDEYTYVSGTPEADFANILPGGKRDIRLTLAAKPIIDVMEKKTFRFNIWNYDSRSKAVRDWTDAFSVNYYRVSVPFRFISEKPVQGVIRASSGKSYYFRTERQSLDYTAAVYVPWSNEDYVIAFLGARIESEAATKYSFAINDQPPIDWETLRPVDFLREFKPQNEYEATAPVINITEGSRGFMGYLAGDSIDYYRIKLGNEPHENKWVSDMAWVPQGSFQMGSNWEQPVHTVTFTHGFHIGKYPLTQDEYQLVMSYNPSSFLGNMRPVEQVTWFDAVEFCNKLSEMEELEPVYTISNRTPATGYPITSAAVTANWAANGYRLPTEAQWEYAAKGGNGSPGNFAHSGSNNPDTVAWYAVNSGLTTQAVGTKAPNSLGIYDMSGNVWEWCWDWYDIYPNSAQTNPVGAGSGTRRVSRGGAYNTALSNLRSTYRNDNNTPSVRSNNLGFRVVRP